MSQDVKFSNQYIVKTSANDNRAGYLETEVSGTTDNIIITIEDSGGDKYLKFDIGSNVLTQGNKNELLSYTITGSRNNNNDLDRDMEINGVLTSHTPILLPQPTLLKYIAMISNGNATWEAHVLVNNVSIASLSAVNVNYVVSSLIDTLIDVGDAIRLRLENAVGAVDRPRIIIVLQS